MNNSNNDNLAFANLLIREEPQAFLVMQKILANLQQSRVLIKSL